MIEIQAQTNTAKWNIWHVAVGLLIMEALWRRLIPHSLWGTFVFSVLLFLTPIIFLRFVINDTLSKMGLTTKKIMSNILIGFGLAIAYLPLLAVLFGMVNRLPTALRTYLLKGGIPDGTFYNKFIHLPMALNIIFIMVFVLGSLVFYIGFTYPPIRQRLGIFWGIIIVGLIFPLLSIIQQGEIYSIFSYIASFIVGIMLAYSFERTNSIIPSITWASLFWLISIISKGQ